MFPGMVNVQFSALGFIFIIPYE